MIANKEKTESKVDPMEDNDPSATGKIPTILRVDDLSFSYGRVPVLRGINLEMLKGGVTCLMGRNGVGKTTLIKNIMGLLAPKRGEIHLKDKNVTDWKAYHRARYGISLVPQGRFIFPTITVEENLKIGLEGRPKRDRQISEEIYELFPVLWEMRNRKGGDLSGGQQQQLAIGRALAGNPEVLLLDEPTEGIQPNIIQRIGEVITKLALEKKIAILLVEQYVDFVKEFGHYAYIMDRGRIVDETPAPGIDEEHIKNFLSV